MSEQLNESSNRWQEITETIDTTEASLFWLNLSVIKNGVKKALDKIKEFFWLSKNDNNNEETSTQSNETTTQENESAEAQSGSNTVSEDMFKELLSMEWNQNFTAKTHWSNFWETFATGPYGMVYKHIDENWNLLKTPVPFKNGETVSPSWAKKNARAYYNKKAKQRKETLDKKWCKYSQNMLDALVSASWWTVASYNRLKEYVTSHRNNKNSIYDFWTKFATRAAWNNKEMPWLVRRRKFEVNRFKWIKKPFSSYRVR